MSQSIHYLFSQCLRPSGNVAIYPLSILAMSSAIRKCRNLSTIYSRNVLGHPEVSQSIHYLFSQCLRPSGSVAIYPLSILAMSSAIRKCRNLSTIYYRNVFGHPEVSQSIHYLFSQCLRPSRSVTIYPLSQYMCPF